MHFFSSFFIQAYKIKLEASLFSIFLIRLFLVIMARILLHFGYDLLDILEEFTEGTYYFLIFSKKLVVWEAKAQVRPVWGKYLNFSYYWLRDFFLAAFVLLVALPWIFDKLFTFLFSFTAKTALTDWYDDSYAEDELDKAVLQDNKKFRRIEYLIKYREERIRRNLLKLSLFFSLYKKAQVLYKGRANLWFFKRSNAFFRAEHRFAPQGKKPKFYSFVFKKVRAYISKKYNYWKILSRRW